MQNADANPIARQDRALIFAGISLVTLLAWAYLFYDAARMSVGACCAPLGRAWTARDVLMLFIMWSVMMIGMMLPSATPAILLFASINANRRREQRLLARSGFFTLGYLLVWTGFSALATLLQWALHTRALLSPMMVSTSPAFGAIVLAAAGAFQLSPLKNACLARCRTPFAFFMTHWREGATGALTMGIRFGSFCVGCCWLLMCVLFVTGVMNILWVALITIFVLAEKALPVSIRLDRIAGVTMIALGCWLGLLALCG